MARPTSPKERQRQQQQARAESRQAVDDKARRRRRLLGIIGLVVVLTLVLGTVAAVISGSTSDSTSDTSTDSTASTTTTVAASGTAEIPEVEPGATLTGATPCPAEDGSSPRTTLFAEPPPTCIDLTRDYQALVHTSVGDLTLLLSTSQAPGAVNNFVVLARYHYFDDQAFGLIVSKTLAAVTPTFTGSPDSPGYTLPSEVPPQGQMRGPYTVSALPVDSSGAFDGSFFITTFSNAPDTEAQPTTFGLVLDGDDAVKAINAAGSEDGSPTSAVIITGIEITPSVPVS